MTHTSDEKTPAYDTIRIRGARTHNLKSIDVDLPKHRITAVTGVSGSGKSSLVFGTVAAESRRLIDETYSAFLQGFMPSRDRPDVDVLSGLTAAIAVGQERLGADPRSTVGTVTDVDAMLRILFSRLAEPHIGSPQAYSFNVASVSGAGAVTMDKGGRAVKERRSFSVTGGMCPRCEGCGEVSDFDLTALYDETKSIRDGALLVPNYGVNGWYGRIFTGCGFFDPDKPIARFGKRELDALLYKEPTRIKVDGVNVTFEGLIPRIRKTFLSKDRDAMQPHIRAFVDRAITFGTCPECDGTRLNDRARSSTIDGTSIADVDAMQISDLAGWVRGLPAAIGQAAGGSAAGGRAAGSAESAAPLLDALGESCDSFVGIGLGYLSLGRTSGTLSGGEAQRVKMVRALGSALTDVTYVFDEPTAGLHPHDVARMNDLLLALRDKGNTVLMVAHEPAAIAIADHVVDMGPGAGAHGGEIVYAGTVEGLRASGTPTGRHLADHAALKETVREPTGALPIRGADAHNLRSVDVDVPTGVLAVVTGVAGSGKSSLLAGSLAGRDGVVTVDQAPIKGSRRSSPATYTGLLDPVRKAFAKANDVTPGLFSANSDGACPQCSGAGVVYTDLAIMAGVAVTCPECEGRRYRADVLGYTLAGRDIAEVLDMPVAEAAVFFAGEPDDASRIPAAQKILARLEDVGLGYLRIGQPLTTLSGGERQRIKLAVQIGARPRKGEVPAGVYILDEPTAGLHPADVEQLLALLDRLVDSGVSVVVIEHHRAVIAHADWVIDLGPGAGRDGGRVVFEGPPRDLAAGATTVTGRYLADYLAGG